MSALTTSPLSRLESEGVGKLKWLSSLDPTARNRRGIRRTAIICTIGPRTNSLDSLLALRSAGLNIVRLNFSHGDYAFHASAIKNVREMQKVQSGRPVAIALDTKGPEIRTGMTRGNVDVPIEKGKVLIVTTDEKYADYCDDAYIYLDYKNITKVIQPGRIIFIDDGALAFKVLRILDDKNLEVEAQNGGYLCSRKGVNLPGSHVDLPALVDKDRRDLRFGIEQDIDMVFASFVRSASDVHEVRDALGEEGKHIQIIAKIEDRQGLNNCEEIIAAADGVMVARGDLGIEIPHAEVFIAQKKLIGLCNIAGKPVICATQMLESMIKNPRPTRAEISDVGNAIMDGADSVMLSGETAMGNYPVEAVTEMHEACLVAETSIPYILHFLEMCNLVSRPVSAEEACAMSAVRTSLDVDAGAIIVLSATGETARLISKYRPTCPILMVTRNPTASRYSHLSRGIYPFIYERPNVHPNGGADQWQADVDGRVKWAIKEALDAKLLRRTDPVVVVQGWKSGAGHTNIVRVLTPEAEAEVLAQQTPS